MVDEQGNGFANERWSLVLWPRLKRLCIIYQSNRVSWHVLMVWWRNKKHPVFPRIVNKLFDRAFPPYIKIVWKNCYAGYKRMDYWKFLNICEHQNTQDITHAYNSWTDIKLLGKKVPVGPKSEAKKSRERQKAPFPHLLFYRMEDGFIFHRIFSRIARVNLSVFSKYINQSSLKELSPPI